MRPVIDAVGESRSNPEVFGELAQAAGRVARGVSRTTSSTCCCRSSRCCREQSALRSRKRAGPSRRLDSGPLQFVDVMPRTFDEKVDLFPERSKLKRPTGSTPSSPIPPSERFPLALISPASDKTISSTLGELTRPAVALVMHPADAASSRTERRRSDQGVQRSRRGAVRGENRGHDPGRHGLAAERLVAEEHVESVDEQRARARLAHRSRRRRLLQRRARGGGEAEQPGLRRDP